jgi:hypothetical protein
MGIVSTSTPPATSTERGTLALLNTEKMSVYWVSCSKVYVIITLEFCELGRKELWGGGMEGLLLLYSPLILNFDAASRLVS